jgi:hypothetical protein
MNCEAAREKLLDLAYGELAAGAARELEAHLQGCAGCRSEAARIEETRALYRRMGDEPAPGGEGILLAAARQAAEQARRARAPIFTWVRLAAGLAAVAIVGGVAFELLSARRDDRAEEAFAARSEAPPPARLEDRSLEGAASEGAASAPEPRPSPRSAKREGTAARARPPPGPRPAEIASAGRGEELAAPAERARAASEPAGASRAAVAPSAAPAAERASAPPARAPRQAAAKALSASPQALESRRDDAGARAAKAEAPAEVAASPARAGEPFAEALLRDLTRRRDAGELNEAKRRPDPCPGGDSLRVAWFDGWGKARRLARTGPLPAGMGQGEATRDQYYDEAGRLRLAVIDGTGPMGRFRRRVALDEAGHRLLEDPPGSAPWPGEDLVMRDPDAAFWAPPRCPPGGR